MDSIVDLDDFPFDEFFVKELELITQVLNYIREVRNKKKLRLNKEEMELVKQVIRTYVDLGYIKGRQVRAYTWNGENTRAYVLAVDGNMDSRNYLFIISESGWKMI